MVINIKINTFGSIEDATPAGFYVSHPNNILIYNEVAGSDSFGFYLNF